MATVSRTVCDLHLARGEEVEATTRNIQIDGEKGSVDLCDSCYQENIAPVLNLVEQLRNTRQAEKAPAKRRRSQTGPSAAAVRRWAQEQGIEVRASGRVPGEVREQYLAAH